MYCFILTKYKGLSFCLDLMYIENIKDEEHMLFIGVIIFCMGVETPFWCTACNNLISFSEKVLEK